MHKNNSKEITYTNMTYINPPPPCSLPKLIKIEAWERFMPSSLSLPRPMEGQVRDKGCVLTNGTQYGKKANRVGKGDDLWYEPKSL